jgi:hypothetical protein
LDKKLPLHSDSLSRVSKLLNVQTHERTRKDPTHCQAVIPVRDVINIDAEHNRPNPDKTGHVRLSAEEWALRVVPPVWL